MRFESLDATATQSSSASISYVGIALALAPLWVLVLAVGGVYDRRRLGAGSEEYRRIFDSSVRLLAGLAIVTLAFKLDLAGPSPHSPCPPCGPEPGGQHCGQPCVPGDS